MEIILLLAMFVACPYVFRIMFPDRFDYNTGYGSLLHPGVIPFFIFMAVATFASLLTVNSTSTWLAMMLTFDIIAAPVAAVAGYLGYCRRSDCKMAAERRQREAKIEKARQGKNNSSGAGSGSVYAGNNSVSDSGSGYATAGSGYGGSAKSSGTGSPVPLYLYSDENHHNNGNSSNNHASRYQDVDAMDDYMFGEDVQDVEDFLDWEATYTETPSHRQDHHEPEYREERCEPEYHHADDYERE